MQAKDSTVQRFTVPGQVASTMASAIHRPASNSRREEPSKPMKMQLPGSSKLTLERETPVIISEDPMDKIVASLVAEFSLLDEPLIRAMVSDHTLDQLESNIAQIKDDLGMLQATVIPDLEDSDPALTSTYRSNQGAMNNESKPPATPEDSRLTSETNSLSNGFDALSIQDEPDFSRQHPSSVSQLKHGDDSTLTSASDYSPLPLHLSETASDSGSNHTGFTFMSESQQESETGLAAFLYEMFEHLPPSEIDKTMKEFDLESEGDATLAIERLLSLEQAKQLEKEFAWDRAVASQHPTSKEDDWANFFVKPESAPEAKLTRDDVPKEETVEEAVKSGAEELVIPKYEGPRPNDATLLPFNTQMFARVVQPKFKTPTPEIEETVEVLPEPEVAETISDRKYAKIVAARDNRGVSSGVASPKPGRLGKQSKTLLLRDFERTTPALPATSSSNTEKTEDDAWATLHSLSQYLSELVASESADATYFFTACFQQSNQQRGYNAIKSGLKAIMMPLKLYKGELEMVKEIRAGIEGDSQTVASLEDIEICVATTGDVGKALELLALLEEIKVWGDRSWEDLGWETRSSARQPGTMSQSKTVTSFPSHSQHARSKKKDQHPQNWKPVKKSKKKVGPSHRLADFIPAYARETHSGQNQDMFSEMNCRERALEERKKRAAALYQAGKYFKGGGKATNRLVAGFYASEARRYEETARCWDVRAAREQIMTQSQLRNNAYEIDLHGLTLDEAKVIALEQVSNWHGQENYVTTPSRPFRIITGRGNHSAGGTAILGPSVSKELERQGWQVDKSYSTKGYITVRGRLR